MNVQALPPAGKYRASFSAIVSICLALAATVCFGHPGHQRATELDEADEAFLHTPPGFDSPGRPARADGPSAARLRVTIRDAQTGLPTACRVNVVGPDGNYYEPSDNPLSPWSLERAGNRQGKAPLRYYGWFFYTTGEFSVRVPAGAVRIEVWKGYEYRPARSSLSLAAGAEHQLSIELARTIPMAELGWYSGDTHLHLDRRTEADDQRALDLIAAEDVRLGFLLAMNDPLTYTGIMQRQEWPQLRGFGPSSVVSRGGYSIASGQEYRCGTYGHICLLMHNRMVLENATVDPNNWPVFGLVGEETRRLGGYSFHAHGGYSQEIYADYVQRSTDGVELLQFAQYRGIGLDGWYRMLNIGFQFPGVGASDFPYCRALGDCRTYVYSAEPPTPGQWALAAARGRSFFTNGPLLLLDVQDHRPGSVIDLPAIPPQPLAIRLRVCCQVTDLTSLDIIVNGRTAKRFKLPADQAGDWIELDHRLPVSEPCWIAARAHSTMRGKPNAEAHTNPVYVHIGGQRPYNDADLTWLAARLDERIADLERRDFAEKQQALEYFERSRRALMAVRQAGDDAVPAGAASDRGKE